MRGLPPIPDWSAIVDGDGKITIFFRQLWEFIRGGWAQVPTAANLDRIGLTAALATTTLLTPLSAGFVRVSASLLKTVADGVSSSLQVTWSWTQHGISLTVSEAALTTDSVGANAEVSRMLYVDASSGVAASVSYASGTPAKMTYDLHVAAEQVVN